MELQGGVVHIPYNDINISHYYVMQFSEDLFEFSRKVLASETLSSNLRNNHKFLKVQVLIRQTYSSNDCLQMHFSEHEFENSEIYECLTYEYHHCGYLTNTDLHTNLASCKSSLFWNENINYGNKTDKIKT